jgi:SAM-dependent methyltransferase
MSEKNVAPDRWKQAQEWELSLWNRTELKRGWRKYVWPLVRPLYKLSGSPEGSRDDFNNWWAEYFENYLFLPEDISNYIELGCGPYTNTRIILNKRNARYIVCSDPLIRHYLEYKGTWLTKKYKERAISIDDHPIEECPYATGYFDVVVMINVLDHVMNAELCLMNAVRITKSGGYFILGQDLSNEDDLAKFPHDIGHPIRLSHEDIRPYLSKFAHIHYKVLPREKGRNPEAHYATLLFAGMKKTE